MEFSRPEQLERMGQGGDLTGSAGAREQSRTRPVPWGSAEGQTGPQQRCPPWVLLSPEGSGTHGGGGRLAGGRGWAVRALLSVRSASPRGESR